MKHKVKTQIAATFIGLMLIALLAIGMINVFFLENYYISQKTEVLKTAYSELEDFDVYGENISDSLSVTSSENNLSWIVTNSTNSEAKYCGQEREKKQLISSLFGYQTGLEHNNSSDIIEENELYIIQKSRDKFAGMDYVELWGTLENGNSCLIRSPLESIRESVDISNQFLIPVGIVIALCSAFVILFLTNRLTKPICELTEISQRMAALDFNAKYNCRGNKNEIDLLGENFNSMSEQLETTITELKRANLELERDIADKIKIDEMRKEFLNNVSHELKTPIALIQGYAEGLKDNINEYDPESREFYCDVIIDEAGKMNRMVKQLLNLNQLESGQDSVMVEHFDITALVRGVVEKLNILIQQKEANVEIEGEKSLYVWADEFKIEEVVTNFFTNALNHLEGEKRIQIRISRQGKQARVSVFNTGTPIPEEDIDNIWKKFYKVDKARTREYGGSGIGLSIVKAIMESHHQAYGVKNYNNGVEFWFELNCE